MKNIMLLQWAVPDFDSPSNSLFMNLKIGDDTVRKSRSAGQSSFGTLSKVEPLLNEATVGFVVIASQSFKRCYRLRLCTG